MSSILSTNLEEFFAQELSQIAVRERIVFSPRLVGYVARLLTGFHDSERLFIHESKVPILADLVAEMAEADDFRRRSLLKQLGDLSLMLTGYFPEALEKRSVSLSYYRHMGESAYSQLASMTDHRSVYDELSDRFLTLCQILNCFSERAQDKDISIPRLLENYRESSSGRLLEKLRKVGVIPFESKREPS